MRYLLAALLIIVIGWSVHGLRIEADEPEGSSPQRFTHEELEQIAKTLETGLDAVSPAAKARGEAHEVFKLAKLVLGAVHSDEFNSGRGCGKEIAAQSKITLLMGLSQLVSRTCSNELDVDVIHVTAAAVLKQHKKSNELFGGAYCQDAGKPLAQLHKCLAGGLPALQKDFEVAKLPDIERQSILNEHEPLQRRLRSEGAGDLLGATRATQTSEGDFGNWCGCNSCGRDWVTMTTKPVREMSFGKCHGTTNSQVGFDGKNEVCVDEKGAPTADSVCLRHDYGASFDFSEGYAVGQCEVDHQYMCEISKLHGDWFDGQHSMCEYIRAATWWFSVAPCSFWDGQRMKVVHPFGDYKKSTYRCYKDHCYLDGIAEGWTACESSE